MTPDSPPLAAPSHDFVQALAHRAVLFDGAMGTQLYARGVFITQCFEQQNLLKPHLVREVHAQYARAGAEVLETNTFGANRLKLARHGIDPAQMRDIIQAGVALAREAAGRGLWVAGSLGPAGEALAPDGSLAETAAIDVFREHAALIVEAHVDLIVLETFRELREIELAIRAVREVAPQIPIVALLTPNAEGATADGFDLDSVARRLETLPITAGGFNDGAGPDGMFKLMQRMRRAAPRLTLAAQPFMGATERIEDRSIIMATAEFAGVYARRMAREGVRVIGLCCGGTPLHIKSMRNALRAIQPGGEYAVGNERTDPDAAPTPEPASTRFGQALQAGRFAVSVEIDPPQGIDPAKSIANARLLKESGLVDAINIADGPRATARMNPATLALLLQKEVGIEAIIHVCCRDRNLLGLQADLIGYNALGLWNVLCITGDPPKLGDYPDATAVFDLDAIGLTRMVTGLNRGRDLAGNEIKGRTRLFNGVGANPATQDLDREIDRLKRKRDAGARYVMTQPVYDHDIFNRFYERAAPVGLPILIGILPLASFRNAIFLNNEVPGMNVPAHVLKRMEAAAHGPEARALGIEIARDALAMARPLVQGTYIMPPFGSGQAALEVLAALKN
jgi:homocysteine S-methyltransferase